MKLRRINALIIKEIHQITRDPSTLLLAFFFPLLLLFIFGYGVNLDNNHLNIGLINESNDPFSLHLTYAFDAADSFTLQTANTRAPLEQALENGAIRGIVDIPERFTRLALTHLFEPAIQVITDGSEPNTAAFIDRYAQGVVQTWMNQEPLFFNLTPLVTIQPRYWYNEGLYSRHFLIPGSIAIIMTLIGTLLTALVIAREWERSTMEAMMATPATTAELLLGKTIPYFILGMCSVFICTLIAIDGYDIPFRGSFKALTLVSSIYLLTALGQGLLISTIAKNQFVASQMALTSAYLPAFMLSGFIFDISAMPYPIQLITYLIPARYFVTCLQTLFLSGDIWPLLLKNTVAIASIGLLFFLLIIKRTSHRLDE